ncbi:hypothetical protein Tsp_02035 [Trichinella spiralis]|uniref:hypothetical protein n=1 Tax=Trichinella spiralis TaxID=6334 RepID=UPI0001EFBADB|nr:hypothetical protein Tsp_02035 [Trichinella spiralis]
MDYTTADPLHSRIDGNAVGMLQISVYRQRFVRSCLSAENEPKDAERTEEELHPIEVTRAYRVHESRRRQPERIEERQVKDAKITLRPRVTLVSTQFYSPLLGAGYLRRRPKSQSASSKPPGFRSLHLRLVRGASGQLAVPLLRLLLQGRRLTCHRRMIAQTATVPRTMADSGLRRGLSWPRTRVPGRGDSNLSGVACALFLPKPDLMSTGSWMCHRRGRCCSVPNNVQTASSFAFYLCDIAL